LRKSLTALPSGERWGFRSFGMHPSGEWVNFNLTRPSWASYHAGVASRSVLMVAVRFLAVAVFGLVGNNLFAGEDEDPKYDGKKRVPGAHILQNAPSARQRALAATALADLRNKHTVKDVHKELGRSLRVDSSPAVRTQCAVAIGTLKPNDIKELE